MMFSLSRILRLLAALAVIALLAWAGSASVRIYLSERQLESVTLENVEKAVRLTPSNATAWGRLGALLDQQGDSERAVQALEHALRLNPYNGGVWVDLALHWELQGDAARAERCLQEAVRVDRTFYTRWALANFYLRQGDEERFWTAMREAISTGRSDLRAAFDLCWRAFPDPDKILEKAIPDAAEVYRHYYGFLVETGRTAALPGVWKRIESRLEPQDVDTAVRYADQLLASGEVDRAREVWNRLCRSGFLPYEPLDPVQGRLLTNGSFRVPPMSLAFDWRPATADGVTADFEPVNGERKFAIRFSGAHPESTELLWQWVPVEAGGNYLLRFQYATSGLPPDTGVRWTVTDGADPARAVALATPSVLAATAEKWERGETGFRTGPRTRLVRVALIYRRSPGTTRSEGAVWLDNIVVIRSADSSSRVVAARGGQA